MDAPCPLSLSACSKLLLWAVQSSRNAHHTCTSLTSLMKFACIIGCMVIWHFEPHPLQITAAHTCVTRARQPADLARSFCGSSQLETWSVLRMQWPAVLHQNSTCREVTGVSSPASPALASPRRRQTQAPARVEREKQRQETRAPGLSQNMVRSMAREPGWYGW